MRQTFTAVAGVASLGACFEINGPALLSCEPRESVARWEIVIGPIPGDIATLAVGDALQLTAQVRPLVGGITDMEGGGCHALYGDPVPAAIDWYSSDDRIATVSATGVVRGRAAGDATLTARAPLRNVSTSRKVSVWVRAGTGP